MTNVLHIVGDSKYGGGGVLIMGLVRAAQAEGFEVEVLTTDPTFQRKLDEADMSSVDLDVIRRRIRPGWDLIGLYRLSKFLRSRDYQIVHTHTSKGGFIGRLAAHHALVPVIVHTVHGFAFHESSPKLVKRLYVAMERFAARRGDIVVTVSQYHRMEALRNGIGSDDVVLAIPNGVAPKHVTPETSRDVVRESLGLGQDVVAIVGIGRLADQKGFEYAIRAIAGMSQGFERDVHLVLAGDGPLRSDLEQLSDGLGIRHQVTFLGFRDDVGDLLLAADIIIMPSLWEGLSISLLEAMAAQKPIIATSIPSNIEVTEDGGCAMLVPLKDVHALTAAIQTLAGDSAARIQLGAAAAARYQEFYTEDRMLTEYVAVYRELMKLKVGDSSS